MEGFERKCRVILQKLAKGCALRESADAAIQSSRHFLPHFGMFEGDGNEHAVRTRGFALFQKTAANHQRWFTPDRDGLDRAPGLDIIFVVHDCSDRASPEEFSRLPHVARETNGLTTSYGFIST